MTPPPAHDACADPARPPKPLLEKLGVKAEARIALVEPGYDAFTGGEFAAEFAARGLELVMGGPADVVLWGLDEVGDLGRLRALIDWIFPAGALWAVWRKGQRALNENHVREAALDGGLVDVKVVRFSDTHSALKLVVPVKRRMATR
ncbi:MAG TPA: hypothetical protein VHL53_14600 [Acidimicrobiia bacterium]|nr:hypothetical protein [Acidimicrobiia bacterium]